jgi:membrane-associated HD superfamily phosphohydrolase
MQYHISQFSLGGFFLVSPLIGLAIFCSGKIMYLQEHNNNYVTRDNEFKRDVFLISYSFLIASLISLLPEYDNSDARTWWSISVYYVSLIGVIFSLFFAYFNRFLRIHKIYTNIFSLIIIIMLSLPKLFPLYVSVIFLGEISFFWIILFTLGFLHLLSFTLCAMTDSMRQE